jgi:hypothetical protein
MEIIVITEIKNKVDINKSLCRYYLLIFLFIIYWSNIWIPSFYFFYRESVRKISRSFSSWIWCLRRTLTFSSRVPARKVIHIKLVMLYGWSPSISSQKIIIKAYVHYTYNHIYIFIHIIMVRADYITNIL